MTTSKKEIEKIDSSPVKIALPILWHQQRYEDAHKVLVTNRVGERVRRIVRVYQHRWDGTAIFHRDSKQQLTTGDCGLRNDQAQTRIMYIVTLSHRPLMLEMRLVRVQNWALTSLTNIGEAS